MSNSTKLINRALNRPYLSILTLVLFLIFCGLGYNIVRAWTEPTLAPPSGNVASPLNVSATDQSKLGKLRIGSASAPTATLHVDGTGIFTGTVSGIAPTANAHLTTKAYVDAAVAAGGGGGANGPLLEWVKQPTPANTYKARVHYGPLSNGSYGKDCFYRIGTGNWTYSSNCYDNDLDFSGSIGQTVYIVAMSGKSSTKTYEVIDQWKTWYDAKAACEGLGKNLAVFDDPAEETSAAAAGYFSSMVWLGYTDSISEGTWKTIFNTTPAYTNWIAGEPNNVGNGGAPANCALRGTGAGGKWGDEFCNYSAAGFCCKPLCQTSAASSDPKLYSNILTYDIAGAAICQNGVLETGEACDDSNAIDTDLCHNDCTKNTDGNFIFVSKNLLQGQITYPPAYSGPAAGDQYCQAWATSAGLTGNYIAWLSGANGCFPVSACDYSSIANKIGFTYSLYNTRGTKIVNNSSELIDGGSISAPIRYDEYGDAPTVGYVWTGTDQYGKALVESCSGWTSLWFGELGNVGYLSDSGMAWTQSITRQCGDSYRLYCLKAEKHCGNGVLELAKGEVCDDGNNVAGDGCSANCSANEMTLVYVTTNTHDAKFAGYGGTVTGREGIDKFCQDNKPVALPANCTNIHALVSDEGMSISAMPGFYNYLTSPKVYWFADGGTVILDNSWTDMCSPPIQNNQWVGGGPGYVWSGSYGGCGTMFGKTCNSWTKNDVSLGRLGNPDQTDDRWLDGDFMAGPADTWCSSAYAVRCVCQVK